MNLKKIIICIVISVIWVLGLVLVVNITTTEPHECMADIQNKLKQQFGGRER